MMTTSVLATKSPSQPTDELGVNNDPEVPTSNCSIRQRKVDRQMRRERKLDASRKVFSDPKLLAKIFVKCLPQHNVRPSWKHAPLNLSHVCTHWRVVTHRTPELWTTIRLKREIFPETRMRRHQELIDMWLLHSAHLLVSVHLHYPIHEDKFDEGTKEHFYIKNVMCFAVTSMLRFVSERARVKKIKELVISAKRGQYYPLLPLLKKGIPNVEKLHLVPTKGEAVGFSGEYVHDYHINLSKCENLRDFTYACEPSPKLTTIHCSPRLVSLEVFGSDLHIRPGRHTSETLKRLVLRHLPMEPGRGYPLRLMRSLARFFPGLVHLEIAFQGRVDDLAGLTEVLEFPKLRSLNISTRNYTGHPSGNREACAFLKHLYVPALKGFRMCCQYSVEDVELLHRPHLRNLILRSSADLDTLHLRWVDMADDDLFALLKCVPNLHVFSIRSDNSPEKLVSRLTLGQGDDLCPHLRDITILNIRESASSDTLKKFVASRREGWDDDDSDNGTLLRLFVNFPVPVEHTCDDRRNCRCSGQQPPDISAIRDVYPDANLRRPRFSNPDRHH